jgi:hypothetical protein
MRVRLDAPPETAVQPPNGHDSVGDQISVGSAGDVRRNRSKSDDGRHKPRRKQTEYTRHLPLHSKLHSLWEIDQRTKEAMLMRRVRDELVEHLGGRPSITESLLIERACMLALKCAQLDAKILAGETLTMHDNQHGLAWNNAFRRTLIELGLEPRAPAARETDLGDWIIQQTGKTRMA